MGNRLSTVNLDAYHPFPGRVWGNVQHVLLRDAMCNRDAVGHEAQASTVTSPEVRKEGSDGSRCG